jgi:hypothetical protein
MQLGLCSRLIDVCLQVLQTYNLAKYSVTYTSLYKKICMSITFKKITLFFHYP